jgi:hypothetical protein
MTLEDSGKPMAQRCHHEGDTAHALFAAVAQIALALRESQNSVAELGSLFARQAETLVAVRANPQAADPASSADQPAHLHQLQADVFKGIQQLQFYDRLVQHLTHVQDYLIAVANELDSFKPQRQSQQFWDALHSKFRTRLISDEQRGLLDLFVMPDTPTRVSAQSVGRPDYSPPGDFEMF